VGLSGHGLGDVPYPELTRFLMRLPVPHDRIALSLFMVEELCREPLPIDAALPSWWENDPSVSHARSWLLAGWEVEEMNPGRGVALIRVEERD
jgi:hypothetical protein